MNPTSPFMGFRSSGISRVLADYERSNKLIAGALESPLQRMMEQDRALSDALRSNAFNFSSPDIFDRVMEQNRALSERLTEAALCVGPGSAYADMMKQTQSLIDRPAFDTLDVTRFALPEHNAFGAIAQMMEGYANPLMHLSSRVSAAMESMRTPWLSIDNPLLSATAFAELHNVGIMLKTRAPFGIDFSATLRRDLGDWRDPVTFTDEIEEHPVREQLYADHGLNGDLVEFPDEAFDEAMVLAGLASLDEALGEELAAGLCRSRMMFGLLQMLEAQLRHMIEAAMNEEFGASWMFARTGNTMAGEWLNKKRKDQFGCESPLIDYADFTDYEVIILRKDNWAQVFRHLFGRRDADVRESFQRLYPARLATMHGRPLGRDDYLLAAIEVRRLMIAIQRRRSH